MNPYLAQLQRNLTAYQQKCGTEEPYSILGFLWQCYSESNPVDDGHIRDAELLIVPVLEALPIEKADALSDLICDLCLAYQRAAFLEGIQTGFHLFDELAKE